MHDIDRNQFNMTDTTEDEMLAQAIAMSLEASQQTSLQQPPALGSNPIHPHSEYIAATSTGGPPTTTTHTFDSGRKGQLSHEAAEIAQAILSREEPTQPQGGSELPPAVMMREWQPNKECLDLVMGMGISENAARRALYNTGNDNAELATSWVFENINDPELHKPFNPAPMTTLPHAQGGPVYHSFDEIAVYPENTEMYKMVFVVNSELKMGVGKIAAQVGHATLALYHLLQTQPNWKTQCTKWETTASVKIVVQGLNAHHLVELKHKAYELRLPNIIVHDAGKTQVEPGSLTVFAVFGRIVDVNAITGTLKLL